MAKSETIGLGRIVVRPGQLRREAKRIKPSTSPNSMHPQERPLRYLQAQSPLGQSHSFHRQPNAFLTKPTHLIDPSAAEYVDTYLKAHIAGGGVLPKNTPELKTKNIPLSACPENQRRPLLFVQTPNGTTFPNKPLETPHFALIGGQIVFRNGKKVLTNLSNHPTDQTILTLAKTLSALPFVSEVKMTSGDAEGQTSIQTFFSYRGESLFPFARLIQITSLHEKEECLSFELLGYDGTPIEEVVFLRHREANSDAVGHFVKTGEVIIMPDAPFKLTKNTFDPKAGTPLTRRLGQYLSMLSIYPED